MPSVSQAVSTFVFVGSSLLLIRMKLEEPLLLSWIFTPSFFLLLTSYIKKNTSDYLRTCWAKDVLFFLSFLTDGCSEGSSCYEILCFGGLAVHSSPFPHIINLNLI